MPFFESRRGPLYYEETGNGPPLFFIPPPALGTESFLQQKEDLSAKFHVISFDPAGTGRSPDHGRREYTIEEWTEDILSLADHLQIEKILLCGYSLGGSPSQEFAVSYPERIKSLILICTFPEVTTMFLSAKIRMGEWTAGRDFRALLAEGLAFSHTKRKDNREGIRNRIHLSRPELVRSMYFHGRHYRVTDRLEKITCPVTFMYGAFDPVARPYADLYRAHLPHAEIVKISGAFHQLPTQNTREVNAIITGMFAERRR